MFIAIMPYMNDTIFGKIISGEIPATKVYEDEKCLAFLDINPVNKGHTLLIPKDHYVWFQDTPDELVSYLFITAKKLVNALKEATGCDYVEIVIQGKDVPHFHIHLIPAYLNQSTGTWNHVSYKEDEMPTVAEKIKAHI